MHRQIKRVAVLGAGVMGARIACHFANAGIPVLLLDLPAAAADRNQDVDKALQAVVKSKPAPLFVPEKHSLIQTGNLEDDLAQIADCDWIIEVVVEQAEIKTALYAQIEQYRKEASLITTNTSGIPIHQLAKGRSADFRSHFCGTHFFNPPRYLPLLEIIPTEETLPEVVDFLMHFGDVYLGKTTVRCKDTPAFIANRIGVFAIMIIFRLMEQLELTIEEVDLLTGTLIGHPKSATFRTCDVVGIDTLVNVADGLFAHCPQDEARVVFKVPAFVRELVAQHKLGEKTGSGFYKKVKENGQSVILTLDIPSGDYRPRVRPDFDALTAVQAEEKLPRRLRALQKVQGKAGDFFRLFHFHLFAYVSRRVPEITPDLYQIDAAMKAGFGWQMGPFEMWDAMGLAASVEAMAATGQTVAGWVARLSQTERASFYHNKNGKRLYYQQEQNSFEQIPGTEAFILLPAYADHIVWENKTCTLTDIGDGIVCLDWHNKMNTIGADVLAGIQKAIALAEQDFNGLILGSRTDLFSAGANVGLILMMAVEQDWDELNQSIKMFQETSLRIRYAAIPVVAAPRGLTLGGGCEFSMHADAIQSAAETYMGLVETGLGLIPAGGGTKEFVLRASEGYQKGSLAMPVLQDRFLTIALAKTSTSAADAFQLGLLQNGRDAYSMNTNRLLADAKARLQTVIQQGYVPPPKATAIQVLGRGALGTLLVGINSMQTARRISAHDAKVASKLAEVMCGGDLSAPTAVDETYLLELERAAFLSLCGERKTLERMEGLLKTGKVIRN